MRSSRFNVGDILVSKTYGIYEITAKNEDRIFVKFHNTGYECDFNRTVLYGNQVKDYMQPTVFGVGYLGEPTINDCDPTKLLIIKLWRGMFSRCYDVKKLNERATYRDCTINKEWHSLANFKRWCLSQFDAGHYQSGWELDKDLLVRGNKVYGPDTCCFLPERLNQLQQVKKDSEYNWLPGVNFDKARGKFKAEVNFDSVRHYLPRRETELESFLDYKELKEKLVQADAENWKDKIHPSAYESLKNYSLDWILEEYLDD